MEKYDPHSEPGANKGERKPTERFQDNDRLNSLLEELRGLLTPVQRRVNVQFDGPKWPVGLILGPPRCGTTVFLQYLASTGSFAYPTNLLTRFAYAPYIGALIQNLLFDAKYDYQGEFQGIQSEITFSSDLGKNRGVLAASEFFHFWRNYFPVYLYFPETLSQEHLERVDCGEMSKALASIEHAFGKPFVAKGVFLQHHLPYFHNKMPFLAFFRMTRTPLFVCQSILLARVQYYEDRTAWLSSRPKEYSHLKEMDAYHQVAGQVYFMEQEIEKGLQSIPESHQLTIEYEAFCADPRAVYGLILEKYAALGCELPPEYKGPGSFVCSNEVRLPKEDIAGLQAAYDDFSSGRIGFE